MFKKLVKIAVVGGALLGFAAGVNAAEININVYGASAQYTFWNAAAGEFLKSQGCADADISIAADTSSTHGITRCTNLNGDLVYIRYSSKASYDGIRSVQGLDPDGVAAADGCASNERKMADETTVDWSGGTVTSLTCKDVTVGASDVAAATFGQGSNGALKGPAGGDYESRSIYNITMDSSYHVYRPIVVPFAFFRNANTTTPVPFDNMSRLMATAIFSGQATNWQQFDPTVADLPIVVCMRHAGSGTHATLDAAVMRGDYNIMQNEALPGSDPVTLGLQPVTYFNDGSSDLMRCVGGGSIDGYDGIGAVGYADSDKVIMDPPITGEYHNAKYGDVKLMTWQGEAAVKANIVNGKYDFWSAQWLYSAPNEPDAVANLVTALAAFASNPTNLALSGKGDYWAAQDEMKVEKVNDFTYPSFK